MPDAGQPGAIRTETDGRIFRIVVDNVAKRNAFTPATMSELTEAFTGGLSSRDARATEHA